MAGSSDRFLNLVSDECNQIVGNRLVPAAIADDLIRPAASGNSRLFSEHPVALATLPLVAYEATGGSDASDVAAVGAAMEFLLTAGDVLDDLQDGDLRFDGSNAHAGYVAATELITTLLLLSEHAINSMDPTRLPAKKILLSSRFFSDFKLQAFKAQHADAHAQDSVSTTPHQVLERSRLKSGSLGRCAAMLGATLATDDSKSIKLAAEFGEHLAVVYQLKNDIGDFWPGSGNLDDVVSGKATAPTAFTLAVGTGGEDGGAALTHLLENPDSSPGNVERARKEAFVSGGMHFTLIQSFAHLARTKTIARLMSERHRTDTLEMMLTII